MKELLLEISYKCNFRCIHCSSIGCEDKIKVDDIYKLVDLDEIDVVRLSGGEPTLVSNLPDYIKLFKNNYIKVILQTNGSAPLSEYKQLDVDEIWMSFYGDVTIHNFITMNNKYYRVRNNILVLMDDFNLTIQSAVFNETQLVSLLNEIHILDGDFGLNKNKVKLRLFALLNQGRCNFALPIEEQINIYNNLYYKYQNTELTCSLDVKKCNYEDKLVMKPDGSVFKCASHKHGLQLCKR